MPLNRHIHSSTAALLGPLSRRQFLASASVLSCVACRTPGTSAPPALVGTQLYGWTQYYQRAGREFSSHMDEVLSAVHDCGYDYAEGTLDVSAPANNSQFAERLLKFGLRPVSLYTGGPFHDSTVASQTVDRLLAAAEVCRQAGFSLIICNPDPIGREKTEAELRTQVTALIDLGKSLKLLGLRLGIHNHTPAMQNRAREFHYNFRNSPAGVVDFCYDVHWVYRGGVSPEDALRDYGSRIVSWHLRQSRGQIWWEDLATGDIDYKAVAAYAHNHHLPARYTVELALEEGTRITRSARDNHARSRAFVREVFSV